MGTVRAQLWSFSVTQGCNITASDKSTLTMFEFVLFTSLLCQGFYALPQYYPANRPLYSFQQLAWSQHHQWPQYSQSNVQNSYYPQFYQQQQQQPQYPYQPPVYPNPNMNYPIVGYDLAQNGLPSFPDVVYMDASGHYDQSVFKLTQGTFSSEPSASVTFVQDGDEESEESSGSGDGIEDEDEKEESNDSWWG